MGVIGWTVIGVLGVIGLAGLLYGLHRFCVHLEDLGYLAYRKPSEGTGNMAGALFELDRLTRPSVEHVVEAKEEGRMAVEQRNDEDE